MKYFYLLIFILIGGLSFSLFSCKKWELKQPANMSIYWQFTNPQSSDANVQLDQGFFYASEFSVNGSREEGDDVAIVKSIPSTKFSISTDNYLNFSIDIPMGEYHAFDVDVKVDNTQNFPEVQVSGTILKDGQTFPLIIEWSKLDMLTFISPSNFSLKRKESYKLTIGIDVQKLIDNISSNLWANASVTMESGAASIVVNETSNPNLFSKVNQNLPNALIIGVTKQ